MSEPQISAGEQQDVPYDELRRICIENADEVHRLQSLLSTAEQRVKDVFWLGWEFHLFAGQCYDGRDLCRFFGCEGQPEWMEAAGKAYESQTTALTTKSEGIRVAKQVIPEAALAAYRAKYEVRNAD